MVSLLTPEERSNEGDETSIITSTVVTDTRQEPLNAANNNQGDAGEDGEMGNSNSTRSWLGSLIRRIRAFYTDGARFYGTFSDLMAENHASHY
ncbi:MAG: hypothetical protein KKE11_03490 [Gammaproteobacteria bacterium]|nr:hypothetical protein [Gammaproteobacteria bacterium]